MEGNYTTGGIQMKKWICLFLEICVMLGTLGIIYLYPEDGLCKAFMGFVFIYAIETVKETS